VEGHGGDLAVAVARAHGVETMWTLPGAHVFPMYDAAVRGDPPMRLLDVRHEQTAVFAAEATARLTRRPGLAVLAAGPGVTNGVSAIATAAANGSPVLVLGGRAPSLRWGTGSRQELDSPPLLAPVTKNSATVPTVAAVPAAVDEALRLASLPHRGPVFLDVPMDELYQRADVELPPAPHRVRLDVDPESAGQVGALLARAQRPVLVLGSDVWADGAEEAARRAAETIGVPVMATGMARGILPAGHPLLVSRARSTAFGQADLVAVVGTPLDFRLGHGVFGGRERDAPARVVHVADSPGQLATHADLAGSAAGDLTSALDTVLAAWERESRRSSYADWRAHLQACVQAAREREAELLTATAEPIHPARVYGDLLPRLAGDAVVIGDGGDFVSFAGRYVEPARPGCWLDPGPYGCLGTGLGYAAAARLARPDAQVVLLLGDGAAGFSLLDTDTLVRHGLPVVMVVGNNGAWGLEKHPMRALYGYDVAADLAPRTRYDEVVRALGGAGEMVTRPGDIGPALDRAFAAGVPYLLNVVTDPEVAYPRSTVR
jgi:acetolactate synthase I/II/III large subunit